MNIGLGKKPRRVYERIKVALQKVFHWILGFKTRFEIDVHFGFENF